MANQVKHMAEWLAPGAGSLEDQKGVAGEQAAPPVTMQTIASVTKDYQDAKKRTPSTADGSTTVGTGTTRGTSSTVESGFTAVTEEDAYSEP